MQPTDLKALISGLNTGLKYFNQFREPTRLGVN
jgi:hypothetical protein